MYLLPKQSQNLNSKLRLPPFPLMLLSGRGKACASLLPKPQSQHSEDVTAAHSYPMLTLGCGLVCVFPHSTLSHDSGSFTPISQVKAPRGSKRSVSESSS